MDKQANMTGDKVIAFVKAAIVVLQRDEAYLHQGTDTFVLSYIYLFKLLLIATTRKQGIF
jgi:hypothetical protein